MSLTWSELTGVNAVWRTSTSSSSLLSDPLSTGAGTLTFLRLLALVSEALWRPVCLLGWRSGTVVARLVADEDNDDEDEDEDDEDDEEEEDEEAEEEAEEEVARPVVA